VNLELVQARKKLQGKERESAPRGRDWRVIGQLFIGNWSAVHWRLVSCSLAIGQLFIGDWSVVHWRLVGCSLAIGHGSLTIGH